MNLFNGSEENRKPTGFERLRRVIRVSQMTWINVKGSTKIFLGRKEQQTQTQIAKGSK